MKNKEKIIAPAVPLELISLPVDLNGRHGGNRADSSAKLIQADNDLDAIAVWLDEYKVVFAHPHRIGHFPLRPGFWRDPPK